MASLTEAGSFLANLLIFRIQVCLLIGCVAVHVCVVCIVVGVALQRCSESNWDRTQLSLATEDSTPPPHRLVVRQVLQTLGLVGDSPKVLRDLTKGISFVNFILPPFLFGNNDFDGALNAVVLGCWCCCC